MLSRLWTYTVWCAFLFLAVVFTGVWYERLPLLGIIFAALLIGTLGSQARAELRRETRHDPPRRTRDASSTPRR